MKDLLYSQTIQNNLVINVRQAKPDDSQSIVELMLQLAEFEGYADQFKVNAEDLCEILFAQKLVSVVVNFSRTHFYEKVFSLLFGLKPPFVEWGRR